LPNSDQKAPLVILFQISLEYLWECLEADGVVIDSLWSAIIDIILWSLVCVEDAIPYQPNSFELFGYDVLIDERLRPWLIEVNASPSMARENALDDRVGGLMTTNMPWDTAPYK